MPQATQALVLDNAALAFRGYNVTNLGRTPELLEHPAYGPVVEQFLKLGSTLTAETTKTACDLVGRVKQRRESELENFAEDVALIVVVELAQLELLKRFHGIDARFAKCSVGYSIGETAALILGGVFDVERLLPVPIQMASVCASLADNVTMGVLFSRVEVLPFDLIMRLCRRISAEGKGMIAPSSQLSPNTTLLLGENQTIERFQTSMDDTLGPKVALRRNRNRWPPMHTPIVWRRDIPSRAGVMLYEIPGGTIAPSPTIVSCVTGSRSYDDSNSRNLLVDWTDRPQLLWDAIDDILKSGVETIVHVGPEPNLIPGTMERLSANIRGHVGGKLLNAFGPRFANTLSRQMWLTSALTKNAALLRTPFIEHVILENWLLENPPK